MQNRTRKVLATAVAACALFALAGRAASAPISYTGGDYVQNFDTLSNVNGEAAFNPTPGPFDVPTGDGGTLTGWGFARLAGTNTSINFQVDDGSSAERGQMDSAGTNGSTDRALSSCATTGSTPNFGFRLTNNTTEIYNSFTLTYSGEQWRRGTAPANAGFLAFSYSTSASDILTGSFSAAAQLNFVAPNGSGTEGALDGNAATNRSLISATVTGFIWNPGQTLTLRWNDLLDGFSDPGRSIGAFPPFEDRKYFYQLRISRTKVPNPSGNSCSNVSRELTKRVAASTAQVLSNTIDGRSVP